MERFEGLNSGGIKSLSLIEMRRTSFSWKARLLSTDIYITSGYDWEDFPLTLESGFFADRNENSKAGVFWKKEVKFKIPVLKNENTSVFLNFSGKKLVALVTDMNDRSWLVYPLRMVFSGEVPDLVSGYNGYEVILSGSDSLPAPEVELLS